jgi:divalent metal cation (Fe/Co/Zn/Cd) transporter
VGSIRDGLRASVASLTWTFLASSTAIGLGLARNSLVLVAFGAVGLLDAVGSFTLVVHFRHALRNDDLSERHERIALRVITIGMIVVGVLTIAQGIHRLADHGEAEGVPAGTVLAGASAVVLATLAARKLLVGRQIPSPALRADGWLSLMGSFLAAITVAGTGLNAALGWWWLDSVAAIVIAAVAIAAGALLSRT